MRIDDEGRLLARPGDDVDLLALEFLDHGLDARAAHADAGADRVDGAVAGDHGHLGAAAGIAGDSLDLDDAVIDLRDFLGEQLGQEGGMGAAEEDLRAAGFFADVVDVGADAVAVAEGFAWDQLVASEQSLGAAEFDHHVAVLGALDGAVDDLADAVLELVVLLLALVFAHALDDDLLGGLGGDPAEIDRRQRVDQMLAELDVRLELAGDGERDLGFLVLDDFDGLGPAREADVARAAVDDGADVLLVAVFGAAGLLDRLFHRLDDLFAVDRLFARDGVGDEEQFGSGNGGVHGVFLRSEFFLVGLGTRGGGLDQRVGEEKLGAADIGHRQRDLGTILQMETRGLFVCPEDDTGEAFAAANRDQHLDAGGVTGEAVPVLDPGERTVDAGGADLELPGALDQVFHVEHRAHRAADRLAIFDADQGAVGAVGHDLHRGTVAAEDGDAHQFEAEIGECGRAECSQSSLETGRSSRIRRQIVRRVVEIGHHLPSPWSVRAPKRKKAARRPPP